MTEPTTPPAPGDRPWYEPVAEIVERDGAALLRRAIAGRVNADTRTGGRVDVPRGTLYLREPVVIDRVDGFTLRGTPGTRLVYTGPGDVAAPIEVRNSRQVTLRELTVTTEVKVERLVAFVSASATVDPRVTPTMCGMEDVLLDCATGKAAAGWDALSTHDQNNEHHALRRVLARNYSNHGFGITHAQSKRNSFDLCDAGSDHGGKFGLWAPHGSFDWRRGSAYNNRACDFYVGEPYEGCTIDGHNTEHSRQLLGSNGPSGGLMSPMSIRNVNRYASDPPDFTPDGVIIWWFHPSPLSITDSELAVEPPPGVLPKILLHAYGTQNLTLERVCFLWKGSADQARAGKLVEVHGHEFPVKIAARGCEFRERDGTPAFVEGWS